MSEAEAAMALAWMRADVFYDATRAAEHSAKAEIVRVQRDARNRPQERERGMSEIRGAD